MHTYLTWYEVQFLKECRHTYTNDQNETEQVQSNDGLQSSRWFLLSPYGFLFSAIVIFLFSEKIPGNGYN